jgi:hypothetical protein
MKWFKEKLEVYIDEPMSEDRISELLSSMGISDFVVDSYAVIGVGDRRTKEYDLNENNFVLITNCANKNKSSVGYWVSAGETLDIVISRELADFLDLKAGDHVYLEKIKQHDIARITGYIPELIKKGQYNMTVYRLSDIIAEPVNTKHARLGLRSSMVLVPKVNA